MSILRVDSPYHFGWKHEDNGGGTFQEIDLDIWEPDLSLYRANKVYGSIMLWKPEMPKEVFVPHPNNETKSKNIQTEVFMFGPDAM